MPEGHDRKDDQLVGEWEDDIEVKETLAKLGYSSEGKGPRAPQWLINRAMNVIKEESSQAADSLEPPQDQVNMNASIPEPSQMSATLLDDGEPEPIRSGNYDPHAEAIRNRGGNFKGGEPEPEGYADPRGELPRNEVWGDPPQGKARGEFPEIAPVAAHTEETNAASSRPSVPSINQIWSRLDAQSVALQTQRKDLKDLAEKSIQRAERQKVELRLLARHIEDLDAEQKIRYRNMVKSLDTSDELQQKAIDLAEDVSKRLDELKDLLFTRAAQKGTIEE